MSKKNLAIILIILGIISLIGAIFFFFNLENKFVNEDLLSPQGEISEEVKKNLFTVKPEIYSDAAGFSFQHPVDLVVKEEENQDEKTYSSLKLTTLSRPGEALKIKVEDTQFTTVEEWLVRNKKSDWRINETVLGEMNGKFIVSQEKLLTISLKQGILFLVESPADSEGYWQTVQKMIGESFKVNWPSGENVSSPSDSGIEEIVE